MMDAKLIDACLMSVHLKFFIFILLFYILLMFD